MLSDGYTDFISFLIAVATGAVLCIIYDFFRVIRLAVSSKPTTVFFEDLLYAIIYAIITFCILLLRCSGRLRFFIFAGEGVGFLLFRKSFSRFIIYVFSKVINGIKICVFWAQSRFLKPIFNVFDKYHKIVVKNVKKVKEIAKKSLQHIKGLLYNVNNKNKEEKSSEKECEP